MKIHIALVCVFAAVSLAPAAALARASQRWICIGDSLTSQPGFADAVCDEKFGLDGATSGTWANLILTELPAGDRAVVLLGTNDAVFRVPPPVYRDNMDRVVARLREHYKKLVLVVAPKTHSTADSVLLRAYRAHLLEICKSEKRVRCAEPILVPSLHLGDGVHPNSAGHSLIALEVNRVQRGKK